MTPTMRPRILVVDDEKLNRRLIQAILGPEGYDIILCESGEQALEIVARGTIDLVLLDVMMPGIDGIEVCRRIRTDLAQPLLPVVILSALADPLSRTRGTKAGADDFLTKPLHQDELLARVRNLLLLRSLYKLSEDQRTAAERDARRWRLASEVATAVAGCLDHQDLVTTVFRRLKQEMSVDTAVLFSVEDEHLEVAASTRDVIEPAIGWSREQSVDALGDVQRVVLSREHLPAGFAPFLDAGCSSVLVVFPIRAHGHLLGVFCLGRSTAFSDDELMLLDELTSHVANAIVQVRSHLANVEQLRVSEQRHRILFDSSPLPMWVFAPTTLRFLGVNDALVRLLGYSREELLSMHLSQLKPAEDLARLTTGMASATAGRSTHVGPVRYICRDTRIVQLDITADATIVDGELVMLAIGVDVTHSQRMEEQLRQSQKMDAIGQLAGGVAHDFNNILAAILANAEMAREDLGEGHPSAIEIGEIEVAAHRAAVLTRQLLTFSRQEKRETKVLALNAVVANIEKMLVRLVREDIEIATVLKPDVGSVDADAGQLEQVLMNLVVNSRDSMPAGGRITIETAQVDVDGSQASQLGVVTGRYVTLAVSDTGCGMDAATQTRIFEPFFTTKAVGKGTGLGLSTAFGIVKQSQGALTVYSEPGRGSTFRVYLPCVDREPHTETAVRSRRAPTGSGVILLVEDDDSLRSVIRRQLMSWGYSLLEAPNGAVALELLKDSADSLDLLVTDLVMPGIDGRALAAKVLAERPGTKVLYMSGYSEHAAVKTAMVGRNENFIEKPFTGGSLSSAIRRAMAS